MSSTITLSWEWILGIIFTLIIAFLAWVWKRVDKLEDKFRELEIKCSSMESALKIIQNGMEIKLKK